MGSNSVDVKVVLLGATGVGKSCLGVRFVEDHFDMASTSTVGAHFISKIVSVDDVSVRLNIWDTSGQERYRSLIKGFYRNSAVAILVIDVTSVDSFEALRYWVDELRQNTECMPILAIACNKVDLVGGGRAVAMQPVLDYAETIGVRIVMDTSAKDGTNVTALFRNAAQLVLNPASTPRAHTLSAQTDAVTLGDEAHKMKARSGCC